jgi:ATP-dependent DNA helicase RecG
MSSDESTVRLSFFAKIHDGFELSELDLKLRGSGDVFGNSQTGWGFLYFTARDADLVPKARVRAGEILDQSPDLRKFPLLKNLSEQLTIHLE